MQTIVTNESSLQIKSLQLNQIITIKITKFTLTTLRKQLKKFKERENITASMTVWGEEKVIQEHYTPPFLQSESQNKSD